MSEKSDSASYNIAFPIRRKKIFLIILTLMSTAGLIGSDVYLPTLPFIGEDFGENSHSMQLTLGIYLFGLSVGQLFFGPLTDKYGRKKLVIWGMVLYLLSSLSCAFSASYTQLLLSRFFQAIGACSSLTISRAIVGDIFNSKDSGKIFATIFPFVGMSPAISPVIGGFLGFYLGWRSTFIFIALFPLVIIILVNFYLPETLSFSKRQPLNLIKLITTYPKLLMAKKFLAYVSAPCAAYFAYFAYITQSPFILHKYGFGEKAIGTFYITLSITYVIGNLVSKRLLDYFGLNQLIKLGYGIFFTGGALMFLSGLLSEFPLVLMTCAISILTIGNGFLIPLGTAGVINSSPNFIGYASGLLGFLQLGSAAISSSIVGPLSRNTVLGLGSYILFVTFVSMISFLFLIKSEAKIRHVQ